MTLDEKINNAIQNSLEKLDPSFQKHFEGKESELAEKVRDELRSEGYGWNVTTRIVEEFASQILLPSI